MRNGTFWFFFMGEGEFSDWSVKFRKFRFTEGLNFLDRGEEGRQIETGLKREIGGEL